MPQEIDDDEAGEARPALSKTKESLRTFGQHSYYYAWSEEKKQQYVPPPKPPQLLPMLPLPPPQTAIVPGEHNAHTEIVSRGPGEDWVDPPPPGGWMIVAPAPAYSAEQLFTWSNWVSPPRGWPDTFEGIPKLKEFIFKKLAGVHGSPSRQTRVRLTLPAHPMEIERMAELNVRLSDTDSKANALAVRRKLGWEVVGGFALLELAQGCDRKVPVEQPVYHGEHYYWNVTPLGLWIDLTPRKHHKKLVLVESAQTAVPPPSAAETEALAQPAERADEMLVDFVVGTTELLGVRLTAKTLDPVKGREGALYFLDACLNAIEKPYRAMCPSMPFDKYALRSVTLDGAEVSAPTTTPARQLLRADAHHDATEPRRRRRVALGFYEIGSPEHMVLRWATLHALRLREGSTLCFTRMSDSAPPLRLPQLRILGGMCTELAPLAVRHLHLDGNGFGDEGVALLLPLMRSAMPHLERLGLRSNDLTDMSACAVAATPPARTLRELDLACNAIGERGLAALTAALDSGVLSVHEVLDVSVNPAPPEAANMLKSALQAARKRRVGRRAADEPSAAAAGASSHRPRPVALP
jgi:hypothetical protein